MDGIFPEEFFEGFGPDRFLPFRSERAKFDHVTSDDKEGLRALVRQNAPKQPGVYGMIDPLGRLVYVGKSKVLRSRLLSYFMPANEEEKSGRIVDAANKIVWETHPSDFAAQLREQYLITHFQPRFNVVGMPNRRRKIFINVGRPPAEMIYTSSKIDPKAIHFEGPFLGAGKANHAVAVLNRIFGLRDCSSKTKFVFADQLRLFSEESRPGCLRYEIENCLGPCVEGCSRSEYQIQVEQAVEFLQTGSSGPVEEIEAQMQRASHRLHFERAARLHQDFKTVRWLSNRLADHAETRRKFTCVFPVAGVDGRNIWYLIRNGIVEHVVAAPRNQREFERACKEVARWFSNEQQIGEIFSQRNETLAIVNRWFRKYPQQKRLLLTPDKMPQSLKEMRLRNSKIQSAATNAKPR